MDGGFVFKLIDEPASGGVVCAKTAKIKMRKKETAHKHTHTTYI